MSCLSMYDGRIISKLQNGFISLMENRNVITMLSTKMFRSTAGLRVPYGHTIGEPVGAVSNIKAACACVRHSNNARGFVCVCVK